MLLLAEDAAFLHCSVLIARGVSVSRTTCAAGTAQKAPHLLPQPQQHLFPHNNRPLFSTIKRTQCSNLRWCYQPFQVVLHRLVESTASAQCSGKSNRLQVTRTLFSCRVQLLSAQVAQQGTTTCGMRSFSLGV